VRSGISSAMPASAAAAHRDQETREDHVIETINRLIDEEKVVNVVEDPRNAFVRAASAEGASATAKWMAGKMRDGNQVGTTCTSTHSRVYFVHLTMCAFH
jgi:hypothetical protein